MITPAQEVRGFQELSGSAARSGKITIASTSLGRWRHGRSQRIHCRELAGFSPMFFKGCRDLPTFIYQQSESAEIKVSKTPVEEFGITGERCQEQEGLAGSWKGCKVVRYA